MTAGVAASLARGEPLHNALRVGAACGAVDLVRRGLGTAGHIGVQAMAERVELCPWEGQR
ncbi:MAG: 6-phosphofructokinase [Pseudonocardia sp.]|nr:6-phosphofructokinase [Pseudonocardia sp.]